MKKSFLFLIAAALMASACTPKEIEPVVPEDDPQDVVTHAELSAVILNDAETRTDYTIDEVNKKARFSWIDGDAIDVLVNYKGVYTPVRFVTDGWGTEVRFQDGTIAGDVTMADLVAEDASAALADWAFYPSRKDEAALEGNYLIDWDVNYQTGAVTVDIPSELTLPAKPMSVIPLLGKKDGTSNTYSFRPMTAVLAVPVNNLPAGADFASISCDDAAISGYFTVDPSSLTVSQGSAITAQHSLTLNFSNLQQDDVTFYFPVPIGTIPAGLTLSVGKKDNPEATMVITTKEALNMQKGKMTLTPALSFTLADQQWEYYADAEYIDDFLWSKHSSYTSGTRVPVTVERSGLHPDKYRINNPYTVANSQFGYTPHTDGIVADDYFVFYIKDGKLSFNNFKTGIEDSDTGGRPMQIIYRQEKAANTYIVSTSVDGYPTELLMGGRFVDPDDASYFYTRDETGNNAPTMHLYISHDWIEVAEGEFIDTFLWGSGYQNWGSTRVPVTLEQNISDSNKLRVANPYLAAAEYFNYTPYSDGITGDKYLEITLQDNDALVFTTFIAGIEDKPVGGKPMKIWLPTDFSPAYGDNSYNKVISWRSDGLPAELQLACRYSQVVNPTEYIYTKDTAPSLHLYFPEPVETWTSLGVGRYTDEFLWNANNFPPYDVEVEIERSSLNPNRYRIQNPYTVANSVFKRTAATGDADEYMYVEVDQSTGYVKFGSVVTGMTKGSENKNFAIADAPTWESVKTKGSAISESESKVIEGTNDAPARIKLYSAYYDSADVSYFYTNSTKYKYIWFPGGYYSGETWSYHCDGIFKDGLYDEKINKSTPRIGAVDITIERSSKNSNRYRIPNPYRPNVDASLLVSTYDEYLYFQIGENGLVWFEPFRAGITMDNSPRELMIVHPVSYNLNYAGNAPLGNSNVMEGTYSQPQKVQLAPCYYDITNPTGYQYLRANNDYTSQRIFITFDNSYKVSVSSRQYPMKANFDEPVEVLTLPSGTLERLVVKVTGINPANVLGLRLDGVMDEYVAPDSEGVVTMTSFSNASVSGNVTLCCKLNNIEIGPSIRFLVQEVVIDGVSIPVRQDTKVAHYCGLVLNTANDVVHVQGTDRTVNYFRIPALVTSNDGTLIAAYDVRYNSSVDLQGDIDVGVKRSTDGGKTWSELSLAMDMGEYGGLEQAQNGIGDPCLLVDENTGDIYCFAVWTHGHPGSRALSYAGTGFEIADTPQFMMVKSSDNGATWSEPINITRQLKKYDWRMTFQGPGRGITMKDGTLVIPMQHQEKINGSYTLNSGIAYSTDHGLTWHTHNLACTVTSECTVAEIEPGVLLLSMRDETGSHTRRNFITTDLGRSWTAHSSDKQWLEPTCEACLLHVDAGDNASGKELLLFSNPNSGGRNHVSIRVSTDDGLSWNNTVLLDEGGNLGTYSCITMIDPDTVGIVYESSRGNILFQSVPIADLVR